MNIAIIPARGGSKRIPHKNIKLFKDLPMIAWSIKAAQKAGCFDQILVSTDDPEIAEVAKKFGAQVPFLRPSHLSDDHTGTVEVIRHALDWLAQNKVVPNFVCCLYATAPLIESSDILEGLSLMQSTNADYVFTVTRFNYPIQRAVTLTPKGYLKMMHPEYRDTRSQDLQPAFHDAGQFYWGRRQSWIDHPSPLEAHSLPLILPSHRVQDIDTQEDWIRAELLHELKAKQTHE